MRKGKVRVGTSGWLYKHWRGTFYPKGLRTKDEFEYYSLFFDTVELNNPFYRLPGREKFENWRKKSKDGFLYIVKASRYITHMKKLKDTEEALQVFLHNCDGLAHKLGPILFQLPPGWRLNLERFETFLKTLPAGYRFAFEFRNPTWYDPGVYRLLEKYKCAFCIYQLAGHMSPMEVTASFVYLRLHGPTKNKYQGSYDFNMLSVWAEKTREWQHAGKDVFIYFDNDDSGYAAFNAQVIEMMLNKDEPITKQEAAVLSTIISAIQQQKAVRLYYGRSWKEVDPYVIAISKKGKGDLFFTGYTRNDPNVSPAEYLLQNIDPGRLEIMEDVIGELKLDQAVIEKQPGVRVVYKTVLKNKSVKKAG
jgi:uncharacterized protein YecE (DUF72 family)